MRVASQFLSILCFPVLIGACIVGCGRQAGAASSTGCTVYALYLTQTRYAVATPSSQVVGKLLLTKSDVDPSLLMLVPIPSSDPTYQNWYVVRVGYRLSSVQRADHALPNLSSQITVTWVFEGAVLQSGYQVAVQPLDQLGPFHSLSAAHQFIQVLQSSSCPTSG